MVLDRRTGSNAQPHTLSGAFNNPEDLPVELLLSANTADIRKLAKDHRISPEAHVKILEALLDAAHKELNDAHSQIEAMGGELASVSSKLAQAHEEAAAAEIAKNMDALTGLQNRGAFDKELSEILESRKSSGAANDNGKDVCLVFIDIDGLKQTNDCYGHAAGDRLLLLATDLFRHSLRTNDMIFRVGGDEMVLLMEGDARLINNKILKIQSELEKKHIRVDVCAEWKDVPVWGFSFGIHKLDPQLSAEDNYTLADAEMYHNKENRKAAQAEQRHARLTEMQDDKQKIRGFENWVKHNTHHVNSNTMPTAAP